MTELRFICEGCGHVEILDGEENDSKECACCEFDMFWEQSPELEE